MDESKIHELAKRLGGRFRLASLVQKRLLELNRGQRKLVPDDNKNPMHAVLKEIDGGFIELSVPEAGKSAETPRLENAIETE